MGRLIDMTEGEAEYLKYRFKQYLGSVSRAIQNKRLKEQKMEMTIKESKCDTCGYAWTDECPLQKCWEHDYKYYESQVKEKKEMKRLTYDYKGKHFCDYSTKEIINRLAECEIMLKKITEIVDDWKSDGGAFEMSESYWLRLISEVIEDGNDDNRIHEG